MCRIIRICQYKYFHYFCRRKMVARRSEESHTIPTGSQEGTGCESPTVPAAVITCYNCTAPQSLPAEIKGEKTPCIRDKSEDLPSFPLYRYIVSAGFYRPRLSDREQVYYTQSHSLMLCSLNRTVILQPLSHDVYGMGECIEETRFFYLISDSCICSDIYSPY